MHRPVLPVAYDCVKFIIVRDGSAFLFSEFGQQPVKAGDVVMLGANVLCGSEPEGHVTVTTIYADTDFLLDQLRWQYAAFLDDRLSAQGFAETIYTEPAQILRLGEDRAGMLMPWLDEMVRLSVDGHPVRHYLRMQALWFQIAYVIAPYIKVSPVRLSASQRAHIRPTLPRDRRFAPLRIEARRAAESELDARRSDEARWTLGMLRPLTPMAPGTHRYRAVFAMWESTEDRFVRRDVHHCEVWAADAQSARRLAQQEIRKVSGYEPSWRIRQVARVDGAAARGRPGGRR